MALSDKEKDLVSQALQFYVQYAGAQLPPQAVQQLMTVAQGIIGKLDDIGESEGSPRQAPLGISEEWFENVCITCKKLLPGGRCEEKITVKFPGKCDPIIKYERNKPLSAETTAVT